MSAATSSTPTGDPRKKRGQSTRTARSPSPPPVGQGASSEAQRRAAAILESLAGERTPRQVAAALGLSLTYFYLLERKALTGLVRACEPQPKGPSGPSSQEQLARAERECQRLAALVRVTQRAVGLAPPVKSSPPPGENGSKRRRRRPVTRALRAAHTLRKNSSGPLSGHGVEPSVTQEVTGPTEVGLGERLSQEADHGG